MTIACKTARSALIDDRIANGMAFPRDYRCPPSARDLVTVVADSLGAA